MADLSKPFIFRTDASNEGHEAVLFQEFENDTWPVAYASRKLLQKGTKLYSGRKGMSKSSLGNTEAFDFPIWSAFYITNRSHTTLNKAKESNSRIMRWALIHQPYGFTVEAIKGSDNV